MNQQRLIILIISALGILATFMPWATVPIVGSINGSQGDGWITLILFAIGLIPIFLGDRANKLGKGGLFTTSCFSLLSAAFAVWKIVDFNVKMSEVTGDALFGDALSGISIGFGLYLVVVVGLAIPVFAFVSSRKG